MNRNLNAVAGIITAVPRASGDEPHVNAAKVRITGLFPAPAGMNRGAWSQILIVRPVPRASGDEPTQT